jgi:hypothetical protein
MTRVVRRSPDVGGRPAGSRDRPPRHQIDAFATPTVVHFGAVLLLSIILSAPWPTVLLVRVGSGSRLD